jgi:hypothetical protein
MKKLLMSFIFICTLVVWRGGSAFAQTNEYPYEKINPSSGYKYSIKRLKEKLTLMISSVSKGRKAQVYKKLANTRLAELKQVVENKDMANFENATKRYYTRVGQYVEYITAKKQDKYKEEARVLLKDHEKVLAPLKEKFNDTTAEWRFLKHDSDYLELYSKKLK